MHRLPNNNDRGSPCCVGSTESAECDVSVQLFTHISSFVKKMCLCEFSFLGVFLWQVTVHTYRPGTWISGDDSLSMENIYKTVLVPCRCRRGLNRLSSKWQVGCHSLEARIFPAGGKEGIFSAWGQEVWTVMTDKSGAVKGFKGKKCACV